MLRNDSKKSSPTTEDIRRRHTMSRIRSKDTSIEVSLRKALWHTGLRYRKNYNNLPGTPDIAITKHQIAIFCDGEFWHGKDWANKKARIQNNRDYWIEKIERNIERDNEVNRRICGNGWTVIRFWGNDIRDNLMGCVEEVQEVIFQKSVYSYGKNMEICSLYPCRLLQIDDKSNHAAPEVVRDIFRNLPCFEASFELPCHDL